MLAGWKQKPRTSLWELWGGGLVCAGQWKPIALGPWQWSAIPKDCVPSYRTVFVLRVVERISVHLLKASRTCGAPEPTKASLNVTKACAAAATWGCSLTYCQDVLHMRKAFRRNQSSGKALASAQSSRRFVCKPRQFGQEPPLKKCRQKKKSSFAFIPEIFGWK